MVSPDKLKNALSALRAVLVSARMMAHAGIEQRKIAAILEDAEYLPYLIGCDADKTSELQNYLKKMDEEYKDARFIDKFNGDPPAGW